MTLTPEQHKQASQQAAYELGCAVGLVKFAHTNIADQVLRDRAMSALSPDHVLLLDQFKRAGAQIASGSGNS